MGVKKLSAALAGTILLGLLASAGGCQQTCGEQADACPANCPPIFGMQHDGVGTCLQSTVVISCKGRDATKSSEPGCVRLKDPKDLTVYKLKSISEEEWLTLNGSVYESCPDNIRAAAFAADTCDDWAISDAGADATTDAAADASTGGAAGSGGAGGTGGTAGSGGSAGTSSTGGTSASGGTSSTGGSAGTSSSGGSAGATGGSAGATGGTAGTTGGTAGTTGGTAGSN
ncbi:MAG: hypothetical protein R3B07_09235 [Polyangiaceae bacterium]